MKKKKLYLLSQEINNGDSTYDSCVVCATDIESARRICPSRPYEIGKNDKWFFCFSDGRKHEEKCDSWVDIKDVEVRCIGVADDAIKVGIVCASFNAG